MRYEYVPSMRWVAIPIKGRMFEELGGQVQLQGLTWASLKAALKKATSVSLFDVTTLDFGDQVYLVSDPRGSFAYIVAWSDTGGNVIDIED